MPLILKNMRCGPEAAQYSGEGGVPHALLGSDVSSDRAHRGRFGFYRRCRSSGRRREDPVLHFHRAIRGVFDRPLSTKSLISRL